FPSEDDPWCVLYGRSFATSRETANLARQFARGDNDPFAIGVLHANVGGNQQYEPYAPCSPEDLRAARMDYWALGHIHQHQVLAREPFAVYPGSPQGLDPNETGGHGCVAVTVGGTGATAEFIETGQVVWDRRSADLSDAAALDDVADRVQALCEACRDDSSGRPALVRITLEGRSGVHGLLARGSGLEEVVAEVRREQMAGSPWVWLDRVVDGTRPMLDLDQIRGGADFAADVVRIADELSASEVDTMLDEALGQALGATRGLDLTLDSAAVLERARDICLDRLLGDEASR
ncbi:MAG TPA: hypothetical protein VFH17_07605, partial [Coriobacteriia bacterium]|nr:hypothetical protein [Coriobacteriia bacterium]